MSKEKYKGRKYSVQEYDPSWVAKFQSEATKLKNALGDQILSIKHVGSTSVQGMAGKPTIDILVTIKNIEDADDFESLLSPMGYKFLGQYVMEGSRLYAKEKDDARLVNLHFYHEGHFHVDEMLKLRDYLRNHPETVREYSDLKFSLTNKYPDDYGSYRKYKDEWMDKLKQNIL